MKRFFALLLTLMCMCSFACAENTDLLDLKTWLEQDVLPAASGVIEQDTLMTTVGTAEPVAEIDRANIQFVISASGETVDEANKLITANISALTDALIAQGLKQEDIWHKRYDVYPNIVYHNTRVTDKKVIDGYTVEIVLNVYLSDISLVGIVMDAAMQSGSGSTPELILERSKAADAYQTALAQAAQQAMEKAQSLAESCGMELGQLVSVKELSTLGDEEAVVEVTYQAK